MTQGPLVSREEAVRRLTAPDAPFAMNSLNVDGLDLRVYQAAPENIRILFDNCLKWSNRVYIYFEEETLTFGALYRDAQSLASALYCKFGVRKGDRIAIAMRNYPEWAVSFWAAITLGAVVVPVNAWGSGSEIIYVLEHSGASILLTDKERLDRVAAHLNTLPINAVIVARQLDTIVGATYSFNKLINEFRNSESLPDPGILPDDPATILYTSGTTGRPKGAVGTHRNIATAIVNGAFNGALSLMRKSGQMAIPDPTSPPPTYLNAVPLFHVGGCNSGLAASMAGGASIVLMYRWNAGKALALIERLRITGIGAVPTMIWQLLEHPEFSNYDLSSLSSVAIGGAAAGRELHARLVERLPHVVPATGYGATETSGGCTYNGGLDYALCPSSVGIPAPVLDVKVVDDSGIEMPPNEIGELCFRGPCVIRSYWQDPNASKQTFRNGWFHSGDIGTIDTVGRITILDRAKDMIIRGGENIYCIEVEEALLAHSGVIGAAVFALPDKLLGEKVAAVVQVKEGQSLSEQELVRFVSDRLANFKIPSTIVVSTEELPKNETGKTLKRVLKDQLIAQKAIQ